MVVPSLFVCVYDAFTGLSRKREAFATKGRINGTSRAKIESERGRLRETEEET